MLFRFSARADGFHDRSNTHDSPPRIDEILRKMANYHLNSIAISSSLLAQEISIENSHNFFKYFLILSLFVFFGTLEHASHHPKIEVRVFHDIHELNMFKKISFLLQVYFVRLLDITYCFTKVFMVRFKSIINVD